MPYINTKENIDLYFDVIGKGPQTLLFIHGWAAERRVWLHQIKYFQDHYRVIVLDLPGHGRSSWRDIDLGGIADNIHFLLATLGVEKVMIVASSLGGLVAIKYAGRYPKAISRLALVGSMPRFFKSDDYPCGLSVEQIEKLKQQVAADYPDIIPVFFRSLFTMKERRSVRFRWLRTFQKNQELPNQEALEKFLEILKKEDLIETFENIRVPILLMGGSQDAICPVQTFDFMKSRVPALQTIVFFQCGHFPFLSKPKKFNRHLEDFLQAFS